MRRIRSFTQRIEIIITDLNMLFVFCLALLYFLRFIFKILRTNLFLLNFKVAIFLIAKHIYLNHTLQVLYWDRMHAYLLQLQKRFSSKLVAKWRSYGVLIVSPPHFTTDSGLVSPLIVHILNPIKIKPCQCVVSTIVLSFNEMLICSYVQTC